MHHLDPRMGVDALADRLENRSRSTASAPAGTRASSAQAITSDPARRSSSLRSPTAFTSALPRIELEQTSSHSRSLVCAGVRRLGFCSIRVTETPRSAS